MLLEQAWLFMAHPKSLPGNQSLEDLLKAAQDEDTTTEKPVLDLTVNGNDVMSFLAFYNIKPGDELVRDIVLYKLYKCWSKNPMAKREFILNVGDFIPYKKYNSDLYRSINLDYKSLTAKTIEYLDKKTIDKTKSKSWTRHFDCYIKQFDLQSGSFWVEDYILFYLYTKWTHDNNLKKTLGLAQFRNFCSIYFINEKRTKKCTYFRINDSIKNHLTSRDLERLRNKHVKE